VNPIRDQLETLLPNRLTTRMLVGAALVSLAVAAVALLIAILSLRDTAHDARHSEQVIGQANLVETLVLDLETGERGFVITGQERFLEPWRNARARLGPETTRLAGLVAANPAERAEVREIGEQARAYVRDWTLPIIAAARRDPARARALVSTGRGKRRVDAIRRHFRTLVGSEQRLVRTGGRSADEAAVRAVAIAAGGFALALALLAVLTGYLSRTTVRPVRRVADAARALASGDLGARVPDGGPVEIEDLSRSFNRMAAAIEEQQALLTEQNEQLREVDRLKEEFVAVVSHELRTPLTSIRGYLDLVLDGSAGELGEKQQYFLEIADRNSRRLLRLVGDLLLFAQIQAGTFKLRREHVDVVEVARDALSAVAPAADAKSIEVDLTDGIPSVVSVDRARLGQVLDNLLSNAVKFTPQGGRVELRVGPRGNGIGIDVADTGMGIPTSEAEHLFERFFRTSNATEQAVPGTGLGLTIVKALVDAHGGRISVDSVEGSGTTFRIDLPGPEAEEDPRDR
jgi:two-component system OmpR family sensor kinase